MNVDEIQLVTKIKKDEDKKGIVKVQIFLNTTTLLHEFKVNTNSKIDIF